jgi:hypothetical protein
LDPWRTPRTGDRIVPNEAIPYLHLRACVNLHKIDIHICMYVCMDVCMYVYMYI